MAVARVRRWAQRLASEPRPLRFLAARLLWATRLCRLLVIDKGDFRLRFYPSSVSMLYWIDQGARAEDEWLIRRCLAPGDTFVDVGANVGVLTLAAARMVGPTGTVYSFEPHPRIHRYLLGNLALNGVANVRAFPLALSDYAGSARFEDRHADDMNALAHEGAGIEVVTRRLDDVVTGGPVALLKVDVEGHELMVLRGGGTVLSRTAVAYVEVYEPHFARAGYTTGDVVAFLQGAGLQCFRLVTPGGLVRVDSGFRADRLQNLVAARDPAWLAKRLGTGIVAG